jgi:ribosomal protein S18 acetylase RimI-like enzyme
VNLVRLLETRVTQFEMRSPPRLRVAAPENGLTLQLMAVPRIPPSFYTYLYEQVGRDHHWTSRLLPEKRLAAEIHAPGIAVHVLYADGAPAGWFELDWARKPGETRLVHFGLLPDFRGRGLAPYLLSEALAAGFAVGNAVMTLETNTLDHPRALQLYQEAGFIAVSMRVVGRKPPV